MLELRTDSFTLLSGVARTQADGCFDTSLFGGVPEIGCIGSIPRPYPTFVFELAVQVRGDTWKARETTIVHATVPDDLLRINLGNLRLTRFPRREAEIATPFAPRSVGVDDIDGDGISDAVISTTSYGVTQGGLAVLFLDDSLGVDSTVVVHSCAVPVDIKLADLDGDGRKDIAALIEDGREIALARNVGNREFECTTLVRMDPTIYEAATVLWTGDLNQDVLGDFVTKNSTELAIFIAEGQLLYGAAIRYTTGWSRDILAAGDFNRDGNLDLVTVARFDNGTYLGRDEVVVWKNDGPGVFTPQASRTGFFPQALTPADVDGDGDLDLVVNSPWSNVVATLLNDGTGTFADGDAYPVTSLSQTVGSIATCDLNGDDILDIVSIRDTSIDNVVVFLSASTRSWRQAGVLTAGVAPWGVVCPALVRGGELAIVVANDVELGFPDEGLSIFLRPIELSSEMRGPPPN